MKLFSTLVQDPTQQTCYYHPGLGTMEPAGALTTFTRALTKVLGMAIGYGLESDVRDAYVFIMRNYELGDRLYMFGFSRGAYTVRAVASLLHMYGLILPGNESLVPYAIRLMLGIQRSSGKNNQVESYFQLARQFKAILSVECKPFFVGAWDTVSSVGWVENPLHLPYTANNPDIQIGRHAVAIDERRAFFRTNLWHTSGDAALAGPRDVKQVWFAGVHCDVGGGYAEQESGLSKIALHWMLAEAEFNGLLVNKRRKSEVLGADANTSYVVENALAAPHESLKGWWRIAEFIPKRHYDWKTGRETRRMNLFRRRTIPAGSLVHESVFNRGAVYRQRIPSDAVSVATLQVATGIKLE